MPLLQKNLRRISTAKFDFDEFNKNWVFPSVQVVHECLQLNDLNFAEIFNNDQYGRGMQNIVQLAIELFSDIEKLNSVGYRYLHDVASLPIKVLYHPGISIGKTENFFTIFFTYRCKSRSVLEYILDYTQGLMKPFLVRIVSLWLDIYSHYFTFIYGKREFDQTCEKISSYIFYIWDHLFTNLRYVGSLLFFVTADGEYYKDLSVKIHQFVIATAKEVDAWSSDTLHCVMGAVHTVIGHVYIHDQNYLTSLLTILAGKKIQSALQAMSINDETMLVHDITETLVIILDHSQAFSRNLQAFLERLKILYQNVKYILTKLNIFCLLLAITDAAGDIPKDFILIYRDYLAEVFKMPKNTELCSYKLERLLDILEKRPQVHSSLLENISQVRFMVCYHRREVIARRRAFFEGHSVPHNARRKGTFSIMKRSPIVLSGGDNASSQLIFNHLQKNGYRLSLLNEIPDLKTQELCILRSSCLLFYLDNDYMQHRFELVVAYKNRVSIILIRTHHDAGDHRLDDFLKFLIGSSTLSSKVVYLEDFEPAMDQLVHQITDLGIQRRDNRLSWFSSSFNEDLPNERELVGIAIYSGIDCIRIQ